MTSAPRVASERQHSDLTRMLGRPFGTDEDGNPIDHGSGSLVLGAIDWLKECVSRQTMAALPDNTPADECERRVTAAVDAALDELVGMLNAAIAEPRYQVTRDYILNENNKYSYEFRLFVSDYCRVISGDPMFFRHAGERSIPKSVGLLGKPLGIQLTFSFIPRLTAKVIKTDLRVVKTAASSAVIQWRGDDQIAKVPPPHREAYIRFACQIYQGAYCALPDVVFGLEPAKVHELRCQADGADCCEWQFDWVDRRPTRNLGLIVAALAGTAVVGAAAVASGSVAAVAAIAGVLLPGTLAWHRYSATKLADQRDDFQRQLLEERDLAEEEFDHREAANLGLQRANIELTQRLAELTVLHESALALSSTLQVDEVVRASLDAIVAGLGYERALVLLADEERRILGPGTSVGMTPAMADIVASLELPYDLMRSPLVQAFHADEVMLFENIEDSVEPEVRAIVVALQARSFMVTPLITKGRRVGVLAVDNGVSGRPVDLSGSSLLMTLGRQIAAAVETSHLYGKIEAQNRTLEERVIARTAELEQARATLEQELAERLRLRERELQYLDEVGRVMQAAISVEAETFDKSMLAETASRDDELGQLARTFTRMAGSMQQREDQLRQQVRELSIEIDRSRQAKQVADIVETEYFQSLRSQARDLREIVANASTRTPN